MDLIETRNHPSESGGENMKLGPFFVPHSTSREGLGVYYHTGAYRVVDEEACSVDRANLDIM